MHPAENHPLDKFEMGTKNHEGLEGTAVQVGIARYNTEAEVNRLLTEINRLARE